jgi:predicted MFS family arabinose efflux permease
MPSYGEAVLHLSPSDSITLLVAMNAANLPGRFLPNLISDSCIGPLNTIIPSTFLAATQIFAWISTSSRSSLLVVACFYGFAVAGLQGLYNAAIFSFSSDPRTLGIRMAMVFVVIGLGCLTGAPVGGALIDVDSGQYLYAQLFAGCTLLFGALLLLAARLVKSGWKPNKV